MSAVQSVNCVERINVLGVGISAINLDSAQAAIGDAIKRKTKGYICVTGVHGVMESQKNPALRRILNAAFLCTPDGMPMVWMGRLGGCKRMGRVYGPDLMLRICALPACRHFLYGGSDGTVGRLQQRLEALFPQISIVGTGEPPWRALTGEEVDRLARQVQEARPDIMWIGLSTPKQEQFMAEYLPRLEVTLMAGVGAAFDIHSGRLKQAPHWMQRSGLEWLYRLYREPKRLWRRYLKNNPRFAWAAFCQILGVKKYGLE